MSQFVIPLEDVRVASPCSADWSVMKGNDWSRHCGSCAKNVYNLSNMTRREAEALIGAKEGHLCVRYYRRADGTILTQDCPVGLAKVRRVVLASLKWLVAGAALLIVSRMWVFGHGVAANENEQVEPTSRGTSLRDVQPFKAIAEWISPPPPTYAGTVMGDLAMPAVPPPPAPVAPPPPPLLVPTPIPIVAPSAVPPTLVTPDPSSISAIPNQPQ